MTVSGYEFVGIVDIFRMFVFQDGNRYHLPRHTCGCSGLINRCINQISSMLLYILVLYKFKKNVYHKWSDILNYMYGSVLINDEFQNDKRSSFTGCPDWLTVLFATC